MALPTRVSNSRICEPLRVKSSHKLGQYQSSRRLRMPTSIFNQMEPKNFTSAKSSDRNGNPSPPEGTFLCSNLLRTALAKPFTFSLDIQCQGGSYIHFCRRSNFVAAAPGVGEPRVLAGCSTKIHTVIDSHSIKSNSSEHRSTRDSRHGASASILGDFVKVLRTPKLRVPEAAVRNFDSQARQRQAQAFESRFRKCAVQLQKAQRTTPRRDNAQSLV